MMEEQKVENKYARGKIYKIVGGGLTYYGSTCEKTLAMRMAKHRGGYKHYKSGNKNYLSSYKIFDICNDYDIVLVENCPCNSKDELHARERYYIENNECININIPNRTDAEYRIDNKDNILNYRDNNKTFIASQKAKYYENNNAYVKEKTKKYYTLNHDIVLEKKKERIHCKCGKSYTKTNKSQHMKSIYHIENA